MKLSLVMIVKNEENNIEKCINNVKEYVDEIIVADTGSTDNTKSILEKLSVCVVDIEWNDNFSEARNKAIEYSTGDWIIMLDADETITYFDKEIIQEFMETERIGAIKSTAKFEYQGSEKESYIYTSRLFPRHVRFSGIVHEQLDSDLEHYKVPIHIDHAGYYKTDKTSRNLPLLLKVLEKQESEPYYNFQIAREYRNIGDLEKRLYHLSVFFKNMDDGAYTKGGVVDYLYALLEAKQYDTMLNVIDETDYMMSEYPDFYFVRGLLYMEYVQQDPENRFDLIHEIESSYQKCLSIGDNHSNGGVIGTGSFMASFNLGLYYELMDGIIPDGKEKARHYYEQSQKYGHTSATERLNQL
ncbi:glycosyltransferase family 2 protein (plasmid) [Bacillus albus]|uniref:glycosyltransferase family 2 protein n=1 Tax=Bacillus cereus group TaxID=86661 RepID=UPI002E351AF9|nr:glycosyltransferase family 2 protein [Bacillus albus]